MKSCTICNAVKTQLNFCNVCDKLFCYKHWLLHISGMVDGKATIVLRVCSKRNQNIDKVRSSLSEFFDAVFNFKTDDVSIMSGEITREDIKGECVQLS